MSQISLQGCFEEVDLQLLNRLLFFLGVVRSYVLCEKQYCQSFHLPLGLQSIQAFCLSPPLCSFQYRITSPVKLSHFFQFHQQLGIRHCLSRSFTEEQVHFPRDDLHQLQTFQIASLNFSNASLDLLCSRSRNTSCQLNSTCHQVKYQR